jgi:hypothetical protein
VADPRPSQREATQVSKTSSTNTASVEGLELLMFFQQNAILAHLAGCVKQDFYFWRKMANVRH